MQSTVFFNQTDGFVIVSISEKDSYEDRCAARDQAMQMCHEKNCSKLLVDLRKLKDERTSIIQSFDFGLSIAQKNSNLRVAHVMPTNAKSREDVKFASTVATNRGVPTEEFDTFEEARKWLLQ